MDKRFVTKIACLGLVAFAVLGSVSSLRCFAKDSPRKPNIVFIMADDLGYSDVGFNKGFIQTPNIDKLATQGVRLNQFYVQPLSTPTRACFLTGRYPIRYGLQIGDLMPWADFGLPLNERILPQVLKDAGYTTAICGKWHLGSCSREHLPTSRGFDHQYGCYTGSIDYFKHTRNGGLDWNRDDIPLIEDGYSTDLIAAESVRLIQSQDVSKPLFLFISFNAPHYPLQVPDSYLKMYDGSIDNSDRCKYAAMVACIDSAVGKILAALDNRHLRENTLVIFCSDNGAVNFVGSNIPLRGQKGLLYEGGVRVLAIFSWPGVLKSGSVINEPIHIADMYPTLIRLAGTSVPHSPPIDGLDIWPTITEGRRSPNDLILINCTPFNAAIRRGEWKLIRNGNLTAENPKLDTEDNWFELFNLSEDPGERKNLIDYYPIKVEELKRRIDAYTALAVPPKISPAKMPHDFKVPCAWGHPDFNRPQ